LQQTGFTSLSGHPERLCALTALVSPLPHYCGGIVSVALSLRSPAVAVSNRPALCCPDFPHQAFTQRDHLVIWLSYYTMIKLRYPDILTE